MALLDGAMGVGVRVFGLAQAAAEAAGGAARGLASLPRMVDVLEQLAAETASIRKLANSIQRVEKVLDEVLDSDEMRAVPQAIDSLVTSTRSLQPLADAVGELNRVVAQLNATISPLQGTAERLGRLVDRLPARGRRPEQSGAIAPPFVAPTDS